MRAIHAGLALSGLAAAASALWLGGRFLASPGRLVPERAELVVRSAPDSPVPTTAVFRARNEGGRPVRILGLRTSCGCTGARATPALVPPGGWVEIHAEADPLPVGLRTVLIELDSDSPATPHLPLTLRLFGSRRPPFILTVVGSPLFMGAMRDMSATVDVICLEPEGRSATPRVTCDLPFVRVSEPQVSEEPYGEPSPEVEVYQRTYRFEVRLENEPPPGTFSGVLTVIDPWIDAEFQRLQLTGEATPPLRAFPAELVLAEDESDGASTQARLRLLTREPIPDLIVEPVAHSSEAIVVERGEVAPSGRLAVFDVRLRPGATSRADRVSLGVRSTSDPSIRLTIPVTIRRAGAAP